MGQIKVENSINLNSALNFTLDLLVKWGMLSHNEAIDLEVAMLTKSAIRYNNDDIPSGYTSKISLAALKKKYAMHQKMRLLSKKRSYVVVCDSQKDIIESDSVNPPF